MNKYLELKKKQQEEIAALSLGFAFSDKQFAQMMENWGLNAEKDLDKICYMGSGTFVQKKDVESVRKTFSKHKAELKAAIAEDKTGEGFIFHMFYYELANHEYGYTGDYEDTLNALGYTWQQVQEDKRLLCGLEKAAKSIMEQ